VAKQQAERTKSVLIDLVSTQGEHLRNGIYRLKSGGDEAVVLSGMDGKPVALLRTDGKGGGGLAYLNAEPNAAYNEGRKISGSLLELARSALAAGGNGQYQVPGLDMTLSFNGNELSAIEYGGKRFPVLERRSSGLRAFGPKKPSQQPPSRRPRPRRRRHRHLWLRVLAGYFPAKNRRQSSRHPSARRSMRCRHPLKSPPRPPNGKPPPLNWKTLTKSLDHVRLVALG